MPATPWRQRAVPDGEQQYVVMGSRLPLNSFRALPQFLRYTAAVVRQLERSDGLVGYALLAQPARKTFWTMSAWQDAAAIHQFARAVPHRDIMRSLRPFMDPTRFRTWKVAGSALPVPWSETIAILLRPAPGRGSAGPEQRHPGANTITEE